MMNLQKWALWFAKYMIQHPLVSLYHVIGFIIGKSIRGSIIRIVIFTSIGFSITLIVASQIASQEDTLVAALGAMVAVALLGGAMFGLVLNIVVKVLQRLFRNSHAVPRFFDSVLIWLHDNPAVQRIAVAVILSFLLAMFGPELSFAGIVLASGLVFELGVAFIRRLAQWSAEARTGCNDEEDSEK